MDRDDPAVHRHSAAGIVMNKFFEILSNQGRLLSAKMILFEEKYTRK